MTVLNEDQMKALNALSPEERDMALKILQEYAETGESDTLTDLNYQDFEEIPVDIEIFLKDKRYLGRGLIDDEGRFTVFPYWVETLKKIFPTNTTTAYNTLILTGGIGLGKSFIAVICMLYLLYRMLCLKDPYVFYGLQPIDKITFSLINITIEAAKGVAHDKMQQLLQGSPWFMEHGSMRGTVNAHWEPPKGIELITGSRNNHIIGRAVFANFTDEVDYTLVSDIEKAKAKQKKLISQVDARMQSRFMKGTYLPTLNIIASSATSEQAFLRTYINLKKEKESQTTLIVDEPQWVIRNDKGSPDDFGSFYVAIGNKSFASEVLPSTATEEQLDVYKKRGQELIKVPPGYYQNFLENVDVALTDIAGISASEAFKFISSIRLEQAKIDTYENPFTRDVIEVGNAPDDHTQYYDFFDLSKVPPEYKSRPLFIHLDMSYSSKGDKTGIAGTWIVGKRPSQGESDPSKELQFRLAFSVSVKAPRGYQVSFEKNKNFIRWLRDQGFAVKVITSDTFQSAAVLQQLQADGFKTEVLSVDRTNSNKICQPYEFFKSTIYEQHVEIYRKCDLLTEEIIGLERLSNGKIEHPNSGKTGSKDQCDAFCGSLFTASKFAEEYSFAYGDNLQAALDVATVDDSLQKTQMIAEFEQELAKLYCGGAQVVDPKRGYRITSDADTWEYNDYQDTLDGIFVL